MSDLFGGLPRDPHPCGRPATKGGHVCRVGGGDAGLSDNAGHNLKLATWFCEAHAPPGFWPIKRTTPE